MRLKASPALKGFKIPQVDVDYYWENIIPTLWIPHIISPIYMGPWFKCHVVKIVNYIFSAHCVAVPSYMSRRNVTPPTNLPRLSLTLYDSHLRLFGALGIWSA